MLTNQSIVLKEGTEINSSFINQAESWEELCMVGTELRCHKDISQWLLGLLSLKVITKYGEETLNKFAKEIGVLYSSLRRYKAVIQIYQEDNPEFTPSPKLPYSLYEVLATMPKEQRNQLLMQADDGNFSVERARVTRKLAEGKVIKPSFIIQYCQEHKLWQFLPQKPEMWEEHHE